MATVSAYPVPDYGGAQIQRLIDYPPEHLKNVTRYEFEDGGLDVNVQPCAIQKTELQYAQLSEAEAQTLIAHLNLAKGKVNDFSFLHPRKGVLYTGVRYDQFERQRHEKWWSQPIRVVLVRYA